MNSAVQASASRSEEPWCRVKAALCARRTSSSRSQVNGTMSIPGTVRASGRSVSGRCISRYQRSASSPARRTSASSDGMPPGTSTVRAPGASGCRSACSAVPRSSCQASSARPMPRPRRSGRTRPSRYTASASRKVGEAITVAYATTRPAGSSTARPSRAGVEAPAAPPLGDVLGVGVLAGVVDLLGGGEQRGDGGRVVGLTGGGR